MNYYLAVIEACVILISYLSSQLSHCNELSYEIHVDSFYSSREIASISCASNQETNPHHYLATKHFSRSDKTVKWSIKVGGYDHDTVQKCTVSDQAGNQRFIFTAFDGSWKPNEIIWEICTYDDFIFNPEKQKHIYYWGVSEAGVYLHNYNTRKYELVMPTNDNDFRDRVFVSNLFNDKRTITIVCVPKEAVSGVHYEDKKKVPPRDAISWFITGKDYVEGNTYTCFVYREETITQQTQHQFFTAFDGSWRLGEILHESYTRDDFIFNHGSKKRNYLWGVSEKGLSLYNFKVKEYQVVGVL